MIKIRRERIVARINGIIIKTRRRMKSMTVEQENEKTRTIKSGLENRE
jgi:hypothetical protein